ncbi:SpoIIE family protein phosphatase [Deltaproteobacteria bacterium TL4]
MAEQKQSKPLVLIVDDTPTNLTVLSDALKSDYRIKVATHGQLALDIIRKDKPVLVLLDVMMPGLDGYEVCRRIKQQPETQDIQVIFVTAKNDTVDEEAGLNLGAVDYITKPFRLPIIKARVRNHVNLKLKSEQLQEKTDELARKNEEITQDLKTAAVLQSQLFTGYRTPDFLKVAVRYLPHSYVSGDIYKIYSDDAGQFKLFLGDSTGHGLAAALTTIMADILLSQKADAAPGETMNYINDALKAHLPIDRFMSAILLQIRKDGPLAIANAGHPPCLLLPANGEEPVLLTAKNIMLGILKTPEFQCKEAIYTLQPGDLGLLYTDGITERDNSKGDFFGDERLIQFMREHRNMEVTALLEKLIQAADQFAEGKAPDDDVTLIVFRYLG